MPTVSLRPGLAAACVFAAAACPSAHAAARADSPYALHSMIYADAPPTFKAAMFRHAAALGASSIRVDVSVAAIARADGRRDWSSLDAYMALARTCRLQVVGVLLDTPTWLAACPPRTPLLENYRCPVSDPDRYARLAGEIAAHARGIIDDWEIRNEPDGRWAYLGTPRDYARELTAAAAAIHAANGRARVLLGGVMTLSSRPWLRAVLRTGAARAIDVANVHIRGSLAGLPRVIAAWRVFFARHGVRAPLWVTEFGYPSDPRFQTDPGFDDGERAQAAYLARALPALLRAGAARVFVTERDNLGGAFASEGLLGGLVADPPQPDPVIRPKPAAGTFTRLAKNGSQAPTTRTSTPVALSGSRAAAGAPCARTLETSVTRAIAF
jgi:hypothetical protein